jgi:hypothetical protein
MALNFGKLNFSTSFNPTSAFPIDARQYFESYASAQAAAKTAVEAGSADSVYYIGMPLVVVEDSVATLYVINGDKTLKPVGSSVEVDEKTIVFNDGKLTLDGFADATTGQQPRIASDGTLEWYTPDTSSVSGLQEAVGQLQTDVDALESNLADNYYNKTQIDSKITSVYKPGGSYAFASLPAASADTVGYVYDVTDAFVTTNDFVEGAGHNYPAGTNVVVIEVAGEPTAYKYDVMSGFVDLSDYVTDEELTEQLATKADASQVGSIPGTLLSSLGAATPTATNISVKGTVATKGEDGNYSTASQNVLTIVGATTEQAGLLTAEDKTKLDSVASGAQANVIEKVQVNGTDLPISGKAVNLPIATAVALGVVRGSADENKITVDSNGIMEVNSLNVMNLVQTDGDTLIINGGTSSVGE